MESKKIPLHVIVATNNPYGAKKLIEENGMRAPKTLGESISSLKKILVAKKEQGLLEIARAHPDTELIFAAWDIPMDFGDGIGLSEKADGPKEGKSDASGCGCSSVEGEAPKSGDKPIGRPASESFLSHINKTNALVAIAIGAVAFIVFKAVVK